MDHSTNEINDSTISSGNNLSLRIDTKRISDYRSVQKDMSTDVLIVGAGISGLSCAYELTKRWWRVIVVEDGEIGSGESWRTTAHISYILDNRYDRLVQIYGEHDTKLIAKSHLDAIDTIEYIITEHEINCQFKRVDGYLFVHPSDTKKNLKKEFDTTQSLGLSPERLDTIPELNHYNGSAIKFAQQGQFHIMKYLSWLAKIITTQGGEIFTKSKVTELHKESVVVNLHTIQAQHIVLATNSPISDKGSLSLKMGAYRTYVVGALVKKWSMEFAQWWDTGEQNTLAWAYHYVRLDEYDEKHDILIVGWEDHRTWEADQEGELEEDRYDALIMWMKQHFPKAWKIVYQRSGQCIEPFDWLAYIGKAPFEDKLYVVTGDSGNGITHGTISWTLIADSIEEKDNPLLSIYSPSRFSFKATKSFVQEASNSARQYDKRFTSGDISSLEKLKKRQGAIIRKWLKKLAVYRDQEWKVHAYSAICTHMWGILEWNNDEKSFDCPCHGSRFDRYGVAINGPAMTDLTKIDEETLSSLEE